jgi:phenylacetate-coenzyme A ligase PaaK-like adenylate-forming protein
MAILNQEKIFSEVKELLNQIESSQWTHKPDFDLISQFKVMTREDLRNIDMSINIGFSKTSGSTGEPVTVGKSYRDYIWYIASTIREFRWLKWDVTKNIAIIRAGNEEKERHLHRVFAWVYRAL